MICLMYSIQTYPARRMTEAGWRRRRPHPTLTVHTTVLMSMPACMPFGCMICVMRTRVVIYAPPGDVEEEILVRRDAGASHDTVSYTHLTLPTKA